jgi:hypothetical protein
MFIFLAVEWSLEKLIREKLFVCFGIRFDLIYNGKVYFYSLSSLRRVPALLLPFPSFIAWCVCLCVGGRELNL